LECEIQVINKYGVFLFFSRVFDISPMDSLSVGVVSMTYLKLDTRFSREVFTLPGGPCVSVNGRSTLFFDRFARLFSKKALCFLLAILSVGCDALSNFGLKTKPSEDLSRKYGVRSLVADNDGNYLLQWDVPDGLISAGADSNGSFEIYMSKVTALPSSFVPLEGVSVSIGSGGEAGTNSTLAGVTLGNVSDDDTPAAKRALLASVKSGRSYSLSLPMSVPYLYIFQVKYVVASGEIDANNRVLIYDPSKNQTFFKGLTALKKLANGKLVVSWESLDSGPGSDPKGTLYQIYLRSTRESLDAIVAKGAKVEGQIPGTSASAASVGTVVDFSSESEFASGGALIGEVKGLNQLELIDSLSGGFTFVLRVQARNSSGTVGWSGRTIVYRPNALVFSGLKRENVNVRSDNIGIDLSWDAASGSTAPVTYQVYGQGNSLSNLTATSYRYTDVIPGETYSFFVTATDGESTLGASSVVSVQVPLPTTYEGCSIAEGRSNSTIEISFLKPVGVKQIAVYRNGSLILSRDYNNRKITYTDNFTDSGLTPNTSYTYTCRIFYDGTTILGSKGVEGKTQASLTFDGLGQSGVSLSADGTTLSLSWSPATFAKGTLTYYIYDDAPVFASSRLIGSTSSASYTITNPERGRTYRLGVRAKDSIGFDNNMSVVVVTVPLLTGLASGIAPELQAAKWSDGTAKIKLTLAKVASSNTYRIYISNSSDINTFDFDNPWEVFTGTPIASSGYSYFYVGGKGRTFSGPNYFVVREGTSGDSNVTVSPVVTIGASVANFTRVPKEQSLLGYDYYIGTYEANIESGNIESGDAVTLNESDLTTCNYRFHADGLAFHSSCGAKGSTSIASHKPNVLGTKVNWHQAFVTCRNTSQNGVLVRLPTVAEWRRASRWPINGYASMWSTYSDFSEGANCATDASLRLNGVSSKCFSSFGVFDMAGNLREWVDARLVAYVTPAAEARNGSAPTVGRLIANGIERQTDQPADIDSSRLHGITPGGNGLALLMGSDPYIESGVAKAYDSESEFWADPTEDPAQVSSGESAYRGFRCVAFPSKKLAPSMAKLALPAQPTYSSTIETMPKGLLAHDVIPETVVHNTGDQSFTLTWPPWRKTVCSPVCAPDPNLTYEVYRYLEPTLIDLRTRVPWARQDGPYSTLPAAISGVSGTGMPLDPTFVSSSGIGLCTASSTVCKLVATVSASDCANNNCSVTDTAATGFNWNTLYRYVILVKDAQGNAVTPEVQRSVPRYLIGVLNPSSNLFFRREIRWRRAGGFLLGGGANEMIFMPMHTTGLDHDYFIQKYPGTLVGATLGSYAYPPSISTCVEGVLRTGTLSSLSCGASVWPSATLGSTAVGTVVEDATHGSAWFGCSGTTVTVTGSHKYRLRLPSDLEWLRASDLQGLDETRFEWTASLVNNTGKGLDNGIDGYWAGFTLPNSSGAPQGVIGKVSNSLFPSLDVYAPSSGARARCAF
jgi:hypothetical protein